MLEVVKAQEEQLGPNHEDTLDTKITLSNCLKFLDRFREANQVLLEVIEQGKACLGPEHPVVKLAEEGLS